VVSLDVQAEVTVCHASAYSRLPVVSECDSSFSGEEDRGCRRQPAAQLWERSPPPLLGRVLIALRRCAFRYCIGLIGEAQTG
jgi:hypothetical protein